MKEISVRDLFEAHFNASSYADKYFCRQELLKCVENGSKEAKYYIEMIDKSK